MRLDRVLKTILIRLMDNISMWLTLGAAFLSVTGVLMQSPLTILIGISIAIGAVVAARVPPGFTSDKLFGQNSPVPTITDAVIFLGLGMGSLLAFWSPLRQSLFLILLLSGIAALVALKAFIDRIESTPWISIIEALLLGTLVRLNVFYQYPTLIGGDPWYHLQFTEALVTSGRVPELGLYFHFPLMHSLAAELALLTNTALLQVFSLISIVEALGGIFAYALTAKFSDRRAGLIALLFYETFAFTVQWGFFIIPFSLGLVFVACALWIANDRTISEAKRVAIVLILVLAAILTHTVIAFVLAVCITVLSIGGWIAHLTSGRTGRIIVPATLGIIAWIGTIWYWSFPADFFGFVVGGVASRLQIDTLSTSTNPLTQRELLDVFATWGSLLVLLCLGTWGIAALVRQRQRVTYPFLLLSVVLGLIVFVSVWLDFNALVPGRWIVLMELVLLYPAATALRHGSTQAIIGVKSGVFFVIALIMLTAPVANVTRVTFGPDFPREAALPSELAAAAWCGQFGRNTNVTADLIFRLPLLYQNGILANDGTATLFGSPVPQGLYFLRTDGAAHPIWVLQANSSYFLAYSPGPSTFNRLLENHSVVYDSGSVFALFEPAP